MSSVVRAEVDSAGGAVGSAEGCPAEVRCSTASAERRTAKQGGSYRTYEFTLVKSPSTKGKYIPNFTFLFLQNNSSILQNWVCLYLTLLILKYTTQ